jgi:superfamily II DNA helicase RecQ
VIDEVQYYFTDQEFRKHALDNAFLLRHFPTQVVLMSGSIPLAAEAYLTKQFVLHDPKTLRTPSARKNIEYVRMEPVKMVSDLVNMFKQVLKEAQEVVDEDDAWNSEDRYIIFVTYMEDGFAISKQLGLDFYHASSSKYPITKEQRMAMYESWLKGDKQGIVTSTALGAGNDYAHVRLTAHLGSPYDMVTYIQQSGRGGRDGRHCQAVLIPKAYPPTVKDMDRIKQLGDLQGVQAMRHYAYDSVKDHYPQSCLVFQMTKFVDGKGYLCTDFSMGEPCSVCDACKYLCCFILFWSCYLIGNLFRFWFE